MDPSALWSVHSLKMSTFANETEVQTAKQLQSCTDLFNVPNKSFHLFFVRNLCLSQLQTVPPNLASLPPEAKLLYFKGTCILRRGFLMLAQDQTPFISPGF